MRTDVMVVVVHGDGGRLVRIGVPRWMAWSVLGALAATALAALGAPAQYAFVQQEWTALAARERQIDAQQATIDGFRTRLAGVREEVAAWAALHRKMWAAFGPEATGAGDAVGVGGALPDVVATPPESRRPSDELDVLARTVEGEGPRVRELERMLSRTGKLVSALPLRWPVHGPVNSEFGARSSPWSGEPERHEGIDIGTPLGTPTASPAAGVVIVASAAGDYGKHVVLDHGNGVTSLYGHLLKLYVEKGEHVEKGQVIGLVGSTGRSTGPHLHYEVRVDGKPVDPRGFLWER